MPRKAQMEEQQFGSYSSSKCPKEKAPSLDRLGAFIFNLSKFEKALNSSGVQNL